MRIIASLDASGTPVASNQAVVPWWSFTKTLLAVAAAQLVKQGRWRWDPPFSGHPFSLRQLLLHRSGLPDYGGLPEYDRAVQAGEVPWSFDQLWTYTQAGQLRFAPGTAFAYSNVGYGLLRRELERAWGVPVEEGLQAEVLGPLGLQDARVATTPNELTAAALPANNGYHPGWVYHGLVIGPANEAALGLHRIALPPLVEPAVTVGPPPAGGPWLQAAYGLGVMVGTWQGVEGAPAFAVAGHGAGGPGSQGAIFRRLDGRGTVAVFTDEAPGVAESVAHGGLAALGG